MDYVQESEVKMLNVNEKCYIPCYNRYAKIIGHNETGYQVVLLDANTLEEDRTSYGVYLIRYGTPLEPIARLLFKHGDRVRSAIYKDSETGESIMYGTVFVVKDNKVYVHSDNATDDRSIRMYRPDELERIEQVYEYTYTFTSDSPLDPGTLQHLNSMLSTVADLTGIKLQGGLIKNIK